MTPSFVSSRSLLATPNFSSGCSPTADSAQAPHAPHAGALAARLTRTAAAGGRAHVSRAGGLVSAPRRSRLPAAAREGAPTPVAPSSPCSTSELSASTPGPSLLGSLTQLPASEPALTAHRSPLTAHFSAQAREHRLRLRAAQAQGPRHAGRAPQRRRRRR